MPAGLDNMKKSIWNEISGKTNPRTKKPYTESDAWAIATTQFKKSGKQLAYCEDENYVPEQDLLIGAVSKLEDEEDASF